MSLGRSVLTVGGALAALVLLATNASAVIPGSYARAPTGVTVLDVEIFVTDVTTDSLCAHVRAIRAVGAGDGSVTINETFLAGTQGMMRVQGELLEQEPVTGLKIDDTYAVVSREDCWSSTPVDGVAAFTIMVDAGAGSTAYNANMGMTRRTKTRVSLRSTAGNQAICSGRRVTFGGQLYATTPGWDHSDGFDHLGENGQEISMINAPAEVRVQVKRRGTTRWVTMRKTTTDPKDYGSFETRLRVKKSGKWRTRFPGTFIDPAQYRPSVSAERRIDVINCV